MPPSVLIFSSNSYVRDRLSRMYERAGFRAAVANSDHAPETWLRTASPDLVVVSAEPDFGESLALCRGLRRQTEASIIMASQHHNDIEEIHAFNAGCDDYVATDRPARAIIARSERQLFQRRAADRRPTVHRIGKLLLDSDRRLASWDDQQVTLTRTEFELLKVLVANPNRVLHRSEMVNVVWGAWYGDDHMLEVHISRMHAKFRAVGAGRIALPVRGIGYKLAISAE